MSCFTPNYMLDFGVKPNGKRRLKMLPKRADSNFESLCFQYGKDNIVSVPCGKCLGCRLDKAKEWAFRCVVEAEEYGRNNSFITLTYDDDHFCDSLVKSHYKDFLKALRNRGYKIRYFGCGEYGSDLYTSRPHWHIIVFGYFPSDKKVWDSKRALFTSDEVQSCWPYGRAIIGYVTYQSAGYVARYTLKKKFSDRKKDEFTFMSLKPGIGQKYIVNNAIKYSENDYFIKHIGSDKVINNHFRYADKVLDSLWFDLTDVKEKRLKLADECQLQTKMLYGCNRINEINFNREIQKYIQISHLRRCL